jgi:hypothetical protein
MCTPTTSPTTSQPSRGAPPASCSRIECATRHSSAAGEAATRGARTRRHGAAASPAASNSLSPPASAPEEAFMASKSRRAQRLNTNSPLAIALAALCFMDSLVKASMGGREWTALKKL